MISNTIIGRHAYLIMCHNNFSHLCKLISELDDVRNDIYIHVDKKVLDCPHLNLKTSVTKANLYFVRRISVNWGGYSQIRAELILLSEATKVYHSYYHLISGSDYPLKSQNYIHDFFSEHYGDEFIGYDPDACRANFLDRVRYYYCLQDIIGRNSGKFFGFCYIVQEKLLYIQKKICVNRIKNFPVKIFKGTNWFSITHDLAMFLLSKQKIIKHLCRYSLCADEIFVQTIAMISPYKENIVEDSLRYIDWERGNPYTFTSNDYEALKMTDRLFARKFDEQISVDIIDKLHNYISEDL